MNNNIELQEGREINHAIVGRQRAERNDNRAIENDDQTSIEKTIIANLVPSVRKHLHKRLDDVDVRLCLPSWYNFVQPLDLDDVAVSAIRSAFKCVGLMHGCEAVKTFKTFGYDLWTLFAYHFLDGDEKKLFAKRTRPRTRLALIKAKTSIPTLEDNELIQIAEPLVNAMIATGLFEIITEAKRNRKVSRFVMSADGRSLVSEIQELKSYLKPSLSPMITPPLPWNNMFDGGFYSDIVNTSLVRTHSDEQQALIAKAIAKGEMDAVLNAVNALQGVPMRLNSDLCNLRAWAMSEHLRAGKLPLQDAVDVPAVPADDLDPKAKRHVSKTRKASMRINAGIAGNLLATTAMDTEIEDLQKFERFYQPHSLDSRGRVYPIAPFSHHNADNIKALFEFADGQPLGDRGLYWLKIHVANTGDFGKVSKRPYEARIEWVMKNMDFIEAVAIAPKDETGWQKADAPFSFVAACKDLIAAIRSPNPSEYISHLPIFLDGSCSGVQHYSAALRAEEGQHVNLVPNHAPADLYGVVAKEVAAECAYIWNKAKRVLEGKDLVECLNNMNDVIRELPEGNIKRTKMIRSRAIILAGIWHLHGIGRSVVKRNVMTYCYSSKSYGMSNQIMEDFMEPLTQKVLEGTLKRHPFGNDDGRSAASYLGAMTYRLVQKVLPHVTDGMKWLQDVAGLLADNNQGVLYTTALGFPMLHKPVKYDTKRVKVLLLDRDVSIREQREIEAINTEGSVLRRFRLNLADEPTGKVVKYEARNGIAPNVIHAADSTHLMMCVNAFGGKDIITIHDSFGVHPCDVQELRNVLLNEIVSLYDTHCPFTVIDAYARKVLPPEQHKLIPKIPKKGSLNLRAIRRSPYAFN